MTRIVKRYTGKRFPPSPANIHRSKEIQSSRTRRFPQWKSFVAAVAGAALAASGAVVAAAPAAAAEPVDYAFDFGGPATPVAAGWIGVNPGTVYSPAQGYGFTTAPASNGFRDRGGDDLLLRDFTIGTTQAFAVDVPNGTYEVTTWAGDLIATNAHELQHRGHVLRRSSHVRRPGARAALPRHLGRGRTAQYPCDRRRRPHQRHPGADSPGRSGRSRGHRRRRDETVTLGWQPVDGATGYAIYRAAPGGELAEIGRVEASADPTFADSTSSSASRTSTPSRP